MRALPANFPASEHHPIKPARVQPRERTKGPARRRGMKGRYPFLQPVAAEKHGPGNAAAIIKAGEIPKLQPVRRNQVSEPKTGRVRDFEAGKKCRMIDHFALLSGAKSAADPAGDPRSVTPDMPLVAFGPGPTDDEAGADRGEEREAFAGLVAKRRNELAASIVAHGQRSQMRPRPLRRSDFEFSLRRCRRPRPPPAAGPEESAASPR